MKQDGWGMLGEFGVVCNFNWVFTQGLTEKLTFDQRFEGGEGANFAGTQGKSILHRGSSQCKD